MRGFRHPSGGALPPRRDLLWYLCATAGGAAFSFWLAGLPADRPHVLLAPVSALAGLLTGVRFTLQPGLGYIGVLPGGVPARISSACSGGNFLVILFLLLVFTQLRRLETIPGRSLFCGGALLFAYPCAVLASALRVAGTVLLTGAGLPVSWTLMHNTVGIATYLTMLCACYLAAERLLARRRPIETLQEERTVQPHG